MKKKLYRLKLKLKFISYSLLGILTLTLILGVAYLNNRFIETSITAITFFIFRGLFEKQYHSKSLLLCSAISIIVFTIITFIELPLNISILFCIVISFVTTTISYYVRDYLDSLERLKQASKTRKKALENLTLKEMLELMPNIKTDIIKIVYGYLHKDKTLNAYGYARSKNISEPLVYKYLKKVRDEYKSLTI